MKRLWAFVLSVLLAFSICGCSKEQKMGEFLYGVDGNQGGAVLQRVVTTKENNDYHFGYNWNNFYCNNGYCNMENPVDDNNLIPFRYNDKYGYCDSEGNVIVNNQFYKALPFSEGYAVVAYGMDHEFGTKEFYHIIDDNGNVVYSLPEIKSINLLTYDFTAKSYFKNERAVFGRTVYTSNNSADFYICMLNSKMEYSEAKIHIDYASFLPIYINEQDFSGALLIENDERVSLYSCDGECICSFNYNLVKERLEELYDKKKGTDPIYSVLVGGTYGVFFFDNGYVNVMNNSGKWGLMDLSSRQMVVDYQYDYVGAYSEGVLNVCSYGKWGAVDLEGNTVIPFQYKYMGRFANGRAFAINSDDICVVLDTKGNEIAQFDRYSLPGTNGYVPGAFSKKGVAILKDACNNIIVINDHGQVLMECQNSDIGYYSENYITVGNVTYQIVLENG